MALPSQPAPTPAASAAPAGGTVWGRVQAFRTQHQKKEIAVFLLAGFLFDVFTLGRIDDWLTILTQAGYLAVLGVLLALDEHWRIRPDEAPKRLKKLWTFREDAIHFLFGGLLSMYVIFYFKSAGGLLSLGFLGFLFALLIANEIPRFRAFGHLIRMALYSFCLTSFFAYLVPVLLGSVGAWQFFAALVLGSLPSVLYFRWVRGWSGSVKQALVTAAAPAILVQVLLAGLYMARAIPPVPLSIQAIGIYHDVDRSGPTWLLRYVPSGRTWFGQGTKRFLARPGDRVYLFARIFAPHRFKDRVVARWSVWDDAKGWTLWDSIPFEISGGRARGFRGFAYKANYQPGDWKVEIETKDGRVIGRTRFRIAADATTEPRAFAVEEAGPTGRRFEAFALGPPDDAAPPPGPAPADEAPAAVDGAVVGGAASVNGEVVAADSAGKTPAGSAPEPMNPGVAPDPDDEPQTDEPAPDPVPPAAPSVESEPLPEPAEPEPAPE